MFVIKTAEEFVAAINTERNTVQVFVKLLEKEEDALIHGRIDELDKLASDKVRLAEKLECLVKQRIQYLSFLGFSLDKAGMQLWLSRQADDELQTIWDELVQLASVAQQINQTNGKIISAQLQHSQRAYMALQGAAGNINLYGPKGQAFI
ncbi:MAG TPA: flagellar protein FlgN [Nitrosomonas sp.]|nr:flagellar protein FlgN [Nitrosomonas sp.]HNP26651.1 flagellar protein FlgN [Nitrosomonas sp.]